ncbi:hypothetical protein FB45DRAFT_1109419 [Roridomyces roridus]|uniref:F-box domain-containing protein n=1 Tax=Roridomyces roridus TaxID=1738132 RepID=A0AAD7BAP5_9AGAR|nr:hypothetical protein FB45DRAFT_1109419 [Roridomyces roridus]
MNIHRTHRVGRLPTEILELILRSFIESCDPFTDIKAIFLLRRVCSRWQAICDKTPMLWTQPYFHRSKSPSLNREIVSTILSRSGNLPVSVTIDLMGPAGYAPEAVLDYQPLFAVQDRLENLEIAVQPGDVIQCTKEFPKFPILASVDITMADDSPSELQALGKIFLSSCPSLRAFSLTVYNVLLHPPPIPSLPLHQLISLTLLLPVRDATLYDMLIQCPLLEECHVGEVEEMGEVHELPIHTMPALRFLNYSAAECCLGDVLRRLRFPLLDSLTVGSARPGCDLPWDPVEILLELHEGVPFQLLSLTMSGLDITPEEFAPLLQFAGPTLQILAFVDMPYVLKPSFFTGLIFPRLATLEIRCNSEAVDETALLQLVDLLWAHRGESNAAFPALRQVQLQMNGVLFDEAVEERLASVEEESNGFFRDLWDRGEGVEVEEIYE